MKKIFLTVGLLIGCIGGANANPNTEIKGRFEIHKIEQAELPRNVFKNYKAAQVSLKERRGKLVDELSAEYKKGNIFNKRKVYNIACVDLMPLMFTSQKNDAALFKYMRNLKTKEELKKTMIQNKQHIEDIVKKCDILRKSM